MMSDEQREDAFARAKQALDTREDRRHDVAVRDLLADIETDLREITRPLQEEIERQKRRVEQMYLHVQYWKARYEEARHGRDA